MSDTPTDADRLRYIAENPEFLRYLYDVAASPEVAMSQRSIGCSGSGRPWTSRCGCSRPRRRYVSDPVRAPGGAARGPRPELAKEFELDIEGWMWELFGTSDPGKLRDKLRVILPVYAWKYRADYEDGVSPPPAPGATPE